MLPAPAFPAARCSGRGHEPSPAAGPADGGAESQAALATPSRFGRAQPSRFDSTAYGMMFFSCR